MKKREYDSSHFFLPITALSISLVMVAILFFWASSIPPIKMAKVDAFWPYTVEEKREVMLNLTDRAEKYKIFDAEKKYLQEEYENGMKNHLSREEQVRILNVIEKN